eukprot:2537885-Alexandrium_andersonii.AAC.1
MENGMGAGHWASAAHASTTTRRVWACLIRSWAHTARRAAWRASTKAQVPGSIQSALGFFAC